LNLYSVKVFVCNLELMGISLVCRINYKANEDLQMLADLKVTVKGV